MLSRTFLISVLDRIAELAGQHDGRRDDHADGEQDDQSRGQPLFTTDPGGQHLVERVDRDRQDQRPQHHRQERREDEVAQQHKHHHQSPPNENIQQAARQAILEFVIRFVLCVHAWSPVLYKHQ